ncbi:MAG: family hydrolase [Parcubacteria group bacterium]|nr:family hydrolase [Parcubacteria group bacterium]
MNKLVFFDLDGTLAESKQALTSEMAALVAALLEVTPVAVISGGALPQFKKQIIEQLPAETNLSNLYLLPTSGAALYEYRHDNWHKVYEEHLSQKESHTIEAAMKEAIAATGVIDLDHHAWGGRIEHRGAQVSLSALGQQAPLILKKEWDPTRAKRGKLQTYLAAALPDFTVTIGGKTTIDITKRGIDKAYGVRKLCDYLHIMESEALYVGDELEKGGNDEAVYKTEVQTSVVKDPTETGELIKKLFSPA